MQTNLFFKIQIEIKNPDSYGQGLSFYIPY